MESIITIKDLNVNYQRTKALYDVSLSIPDNIRAAIIGPNGAGKSTLIKAILDLIPSYGGQVTFFDDESIESVRHRIAYVPQSSEVNWNFPTTVKDVVSMGINYKKGLFSKFKQDELEKIDMALETMNLQDIQNRQISQLSGGQKQRVFLARAIAQDADLYLLDEPLAGVDMTSEAIIMNQIKSFQQQGKTSITVHHDLNTIETYFDYVIMINKTIVTHGPISTTFNEKNIERTYRTIDDAQDNIREKASALSYRRGNHYA